MDCTDSVALNDKISKNILIVLSCLIIIVRDDIERDKSSPIIRFLSSGINFSFMSVFRRAMRHIVNKGVISLVKIAISKIIGELITDTVQNQLARRPTIYGPEENVTIHEDAIVSDALLNSRSGTIVVEKHAAFGHDVKILTGEHDYTKTGKERLLAIPESGNDILIETGAWVASGAIILGPCRIGENAVVTAGSVVLTDVEKNTVYGGVPAEFIKDIDF